MCRKGYSSPFVCLSTYLLIWLRYHRVLYGVLQICNASLLLKMLCSKLLRHLLTTAKFPTP